MNSNLFVKNCHAVRMDSPESSYIPVALGLVCLQRKNMVKTVPANAKRAFQEKSLSRVEEKVGMERVKLGI